MPTRPMRGWTIGIALATLLAGCATATPTPRPSCPTSAPTADEATQLLAGADQAVVRTNKGEFTIDLFGEAAPIATANFVALARCGFYDGISFHRVIAGFVIQAGDPQTKTNRGDFDGLGAGGPGYRFAVEFPPDDLTYDPYAVAMANAMDYDQGTGEIFGGTDTNGSQFFIDLADLDGIDGWQRYYTIFGKVVAGTETVDLIGAVPTSGRPRDIPLDPVIIETITVQAEPVSSPTPG
jgi:cyclophilin family peptidyl-prolyl cis-trans isomerase